MFVCLFVSFNSNELHKFYMMQSSSNVSKLGCHVTTSTTSAHNDSYFDSCPHCKGWIWLHCGQGTPLVGPTQLDFINEFDRYAVRGHKFNALNNIPKLVMTTILVLLKLGLSILKLQLFFLNFFNVS